MENNWLRGNIVDAMVNHRQYAVDTTPMATPFSRISPLNVSSEQTPPVKFILSG